MELRDIRHQQPMHQRISGRDADGTGKSEIPPAQAHLGGFDLLAYSTQLSAQLLSLRGYLIAVRQAIEQSSAKSFFQAC